MSIFVSTQKSSVFGELLVILYVYSYIGIMGKKMETTRELLIMFLRLGGLHGHSGIVHFVELVVLGKCLPILGGGIA